MAQKTEIIVSGAGPTGVVIALGLAQAGAEVTVLEAEHKINDAPRAAVYLPSTIAVLDAVGVLSDVEAMAAKGNSVRLIYPSLGITATRTMRAIARGPGPPAQGRG